MLVNTYKPDEERSEMPITPELEAYERRRLQNRAGDVPEATLLGIATIAIVAVVFVALLFFS